MGTAERQAAERIAARASVIEPEITRLLQDIVSEVAAAELTDLASRLKKIERIEDKILADLEEKGSLADVEAELFDALRYTLVIREDYAQTIYRVIEALRRRGAGLVRSKNSWGRDGYQAVNAVFRDPSGIPFEVQFHTPESRARRNEEHGLYEQLRDPTTNPLELGHLIDRTIAAWRPVCTRPPAGAIAMPNLPVRGR